MKADIQGVLDAQYGLQVDSVQEVTGGWSARAFIARGGECGYFVKQYDRHRVSTLPWIERIDAYMPTVLWLHGNTRLRGRMTAPLLTDGGAYKVESGSFVWMVYPQIVGETLGDAGLDAERARQLALILAELHAHGEEIPVGRCVPKEAYTLPFLMGLETLLRDPACDALESALAPYAQGLRRAVRALHGLADSLRGSEPRCVLCHTDVHGWNLMWADRLMLIDWEGLLLAPVEADLFVFSDGFFFDDARDVFFSAYSEARGGYVENETAMAFYRLRRRIEDIAAFADSIAHDGLSREETLRSLHYLRNECEALAAGWAMK